MICLTRLSGSVFALNSDLIERVDSTPDTVITLMDGSKYVVAESLATVLATVRRNRAEIVALGGLLAENPQELVATLAAELDPEAGGAPRRNLSVVSAAAAQPTTGGSFRLGNPL